MKENFGLLTSGSQLDQRFSVLLFLSLQNNQKYNKARSSLVSSYNYKASYFGIISISILGAPDECQNIKAAYVKAQNSEKQ